MTSEEEIYDSLFVESRRLAILLTDSVSTNAPLCHFGIDQTISNLLIHYNKTATPENLLS